MAIAVIGIALAVAPLAFGMFAKAPKGATMLAEFRPFMTTARLDGFQTDMRQVDGAVRELNTSAVAARSSDYKNFAGQWPAIDSTMTDLLDKVQANVGSYRDMAALPSFRLFPWFFVIPGALAAALATAAALFGRHQKPLRIALAVLGVGVVAAPFAFQMFDRAPAGARMMTTFKTIETAAEVQKIQSYFATMAIGQGAIRLDIAPRLDAAAYPAVTTLDDQWVHILNDMTPMIAAMSDNVSSYQAVKSLPSFSLFPWFFVGPGVLIAVLALLPSPRPTEGAERAPALSFADRLLARRVRA